MQVKGKAKKKPTAVIDFVNPEEGQLDVRAMAKGKDRRDKPQVGCRARL